MIEYDANTQKPKQHIKKQRYHFANKYLYSQSYGFSRSHVWMWELDYKEGWALKNWCFQIVGWRRHWRVPWTARRKNQSILIRKSTLNIHWKVWCWSWSSNTLATWGKELTHWKRPDAGKDWVQEEKGKTENEMVGRHHQVNGHEFDQTLGDSEGQGSQACCSLWGCRELDKA